MDKHYLYTIPEPTLKFYFIEFDDIKGAKFTEHIEDATVFTREEAMDTQTKMKSQYGINLEIE